MKGLELYLVPYLVSQLVSVLFIIAAYKNTRLARLLFALLFLYASFYNMITGLSTPDIYLDYASMALPFYRDFINGWFSSYNHIMIPLIAAGQFLIFLGMIMKEGWVRLACLGAIVFLLAITPLMVGAAFPFPLMVSWAAYIILKRDRKEYLWSGMKKLMNPMVK